MSSHVPDNVHTTPTSLPPHEAVAALQQTIADLRRAEQDKNELLVHLNHTLRTPLNTIIGYGELLQEELNEGGQETLIPYVQRIARAAAQMLTIMRNVRDLIQHDMGNPELTFTTFDVTDLVHRVTTAIQPALHARHNTLAAHCPDALGTMRADEDRVRQSLTCLLLQASLGVDSGTMALDVSRDTVQDTTWLLFRVTHSAQNMTEEQIARTFLSLAPPLTLTDDLAWQGLALSRRVCRAMHGDIAIDHTPDSGLTFTMWLPADAAAISGATHRPSPR